VRDFKAPRYMSERDLLLLTVNANPEKRTEIIESFTLFRGKIVDVSKRADGRVVGHRGEAGGVRRAAQAVGIRWNWPARA